MGLPHLDFRVPENSWLRSAFALKYLEPALSSTGRLAWPYKIAVVAVMSLVACGTLVTFGTAGAETADSSSKAEALPGTNEASPQVQGQVLPPSQSLLTSEDLLSTLNLTDYTPADTTTLALGDEDDEGDEEEADEDADDEDAAKKAAAAKEAAAKAAAAKAAADKAAATKAAADKAAADKAAAEKAAADKAAAEKAAALAEYEKAHGDWEDCVTPVDGVPLDIGQCGPEPKKPS